MKFSKRNTPPIEIALFIILIIQFCLIAFCNLTMLDSTLDCDNSQLYRHVIEMWRNKTLLIPNWLYSTTLEYDCVALFAVPIYGITKNIFLACGLSNIILTAIFIASVFFLFSGQKLVYPLLSANLIIVPYNISMLGYFNMMFFSGTWYNIKVLLPILLIGVFLSMERQDKTKTQKRWDLLFTLLYIFLLALNCISSGSYVVLCGLIPVFVVYFGYKFFKWEKLSRDAVIISAISVICIVVGIILNARWGGTRTEGMELCNFFLLLNNISSTFFGLFELFGGTTTSYDMMVLSYEGIVVLSRIVLVLALLICGVIAVARCIKQKADLRTLLLISVFVWNYFILNVVYTKAGSETTEFRYHLMGAIPLICVTCIILLDGISKLNVIQQGILYAAGCAVLVFLSGTGFYTVLTYEDPATDLKELTEYCSSLDVDHAYMYQSSYASDICRILDLETQYIPLVHDGTTSIANYYNYYYDAPPQPLNSIVIVNNEEGEFEETFTIPRYHLKKFAEVGNWWLYNFDL